MPARADCVCGYRWCEARNVCSWAWTRVDAEEGTYHVKSGTSGTSPNREYQEFIQAREARRRTSFVRAGFTTVDETPTPSEAERLIREYWGAPAWPGVSVQNMAGYHVSRLSECTEHSFTPPIIPEWQRNIYRQWIDDSTSILDVEDPS